MNGLAAQALAGILVTLGMLSAGMLFGWSSPSLPKLLASDSDLPLTSGQASWVLSFNNFGSVFGPVFVALLVDRIGRKWTLLLSALPIIICWIIVGLATNFLGLCMAKFIGGIGLGSMYVATPIYIGEIAEDGIRGGLGSLINTMMNVGMVISFAVGPWVSRQTLAWVSLLPPVIFVITFFWMPETPYYHLTKGRQDAATSSLIWLRRRGNVDDELTKMAHSVEMQQQNKTSFLDMVKIPGNRRAFVIPLGLLTFQQLSGVTAIQSYASTIFSQSGSSLSSDVSVIIMGVVKTIAAIVVVLAVDYTGRRPILFFSAIGVFICLALEAVFFHLQCLGQDLSSITWVPLAGILGFYVAFTSGFGCLPYAIIGEIFPIDVKVTATSVLHMYRALCGTIIIKIYQVVEDGFGIHVCFYGFAACTFLSIVFICFCVPETKCRSLQEIQDMLHERKISNND